MDRRKELKQQYKEIEIKAGVYQIRNTHNQKVLIESTPNLKILDRKPAQLKSGTFLPKSLQKELLEFGADAFVIEVLEVLEKNNEGFFDEKGALKKLKDKWLNKLKLFGDQGYN